MSAEWFRKLSGPAGLFPLDEVFERDEPNLYRNIFPYTEVCRTPFDGIILSPEPPEDIFITDTTFRDGQQARAPYTVEQIVQLYKFMSRLGGKKGVIRQTEFFLYSETDRKGVEKCRELGYKYPEITSWIRAVKEDFKLVKAMGIAETGILTSVSDYHIYMKLKKTRKQVLKDYLDVVSAALAEGVKPRCHFEDVTRADIYGFVVPFARKLMQLGEEAGIPVKIRLCDTMGFGVPYAGAALPRSVAQLVRAMRMHAGVPSEQLEWHGHNDFHKVLVNGATAWLHGCSAVNGTLLGFGERTGNPPIEGLVIEYMELKGTEDGMDPAVITEIRNYYERELGHYIAPSTPFIGSDFNTTRAGIHIDGISKDEEIYNIFDTKKILNRPMCVAVTDKSGMAGVAHWINTHFALAEDKKVDKRHPGVQKIYKSIMREYEAGRNTTMGNDEMQRKARKYMPQLFVSEYDILKKRVLEHGRTILERISEDPEVRSMEPDRVTKALDAAVEELPFIQFVYVTDLSGVKITRNVTQIEDRSKFAEYDEKGMSFSDREWFKKPLEDGKVAASDLFTSKVTGRLTITVSAPVFDMKDEIVGIIGMDVRFEEIARQEEQE
ncbi:histone-lysine N-methyltransferase [bacterium]|nr:MAG: histone-lysine N-methyltransferase [bacterium]